MRRRLRQLATLLALSASLALLLLEMRAPRQGRAPPPFDPALHRLSAAETAALPISARFDHPLGSAHGALTYNARPFRIARHLGDDLNGIGGGNSDLGDPVHAIAAGRVVYAGEPGPGWGKMLILAHRLAGDTEPGGSRVIQSVYAHLHEMRAPVGALVRRGQIIGTVGTAGGQYLAHLHFEIREGPFINPGAGYADTPLNRLSPEAFLGTRRGAPLHQLNPPP